MRRLAPTLLSIAAVTSVTPARAEEGGGVLAPGYLHTWVRGSSPTYGNGVEVSFLHYLPNETTRDPWALGAFGQLSSYGGTHARFALGAEATFYRLVGIELGWAHRGAHDDRPATHAVHVAPFVSIGFVAFSVQVIAPLAKESVEVSFALTVKPWPFAVYGKLPWLAPGEEPRFGGSWSAGGRPLRIAGRAILPEVIPRRKGAARARRVSPMLRDALACLWLDDARLEYSSIAAFRRIARELRAHGASSALIARARRSEKQEIEHARRCFQLASRWSDQALRPLPLSVPATPARTLDEIAVESWLDGCIGEGVAAATARAASRIARSATLRRMLRRIAREEAEHAALAWDIVRFAIDRGGEPVMRAVCQANPEALPKTASPIAAELARHGRLVGAKAAAIRQRIVRRALARRAQCCGRA